MPNMLLLGRLKPMTFRPAHVTPVHWPPGAPAALHGSLTSHGEPLVLEPLAMVDVHKSPPVDAYKSSNACSWSTLTNRGVTVAVADGDTVVVRLPDSDSVGDSVGEEEPLTVNVSLTDRERVTVIDAETVAEDETLYERLVVAGAV